VVRTLGDDEPGEFDGAATPVPKRSGISVLRVIDLT
jgi:hypothetical protein